MIAALRRAYDGFAGRGEAAVTVPPMDGALRPNTALEAARVVAAAPAPDNLVVHAGRVLFSTGGELRALEDGTTVARHESPIACAAADGERLAVGLEDGTLILDGRTIRTLEGARIVCPTALAFDGADLLVALGSDRHGPAEWKRDLMLRGSSGAGTGSVWRIPPDGAPTCLASGLAWPNGLLPRADGLIVAESWRHRLLRLGGAAPVPVLSDLPGYPARLCAAPDGGAWLALFAPRSQLIEFVLREPGYRARMMAEVPSQYWVAPALYSGRSFLEPLQGGGVKQMGILKPWAPTRSYGLVIRLDAALAPGASLHSRADGTRHGTTSVLDRAGSLFVTAKGGDAVLAVTEHMSGAAA